MEIRPANIDPERTAFAKRMKRSETGAQPPDQAQIPADWREKSIKERLRLHKEAKARREEILGWDDITPQDRQLVEDIDKLLELPLVLDGEK